MPRPIRTRTVRQRDDYLDDANIAMLLRNDNAMDIQDSDSDSDLCFDEENGETSEPEDCLEIQDEEDDIIDGATLNDPALSSTVDTAAADQSADLTSVPNNADQDQPSTPNTVSASDNNSRRAKYFSCKAQTKWYLDPPKTSRQRLPNVVRKAPGLNKRSSGMNSIEQTFKLFIDDQIVSVIVRETNRKAEHFYTHWNDENPDKIKSWVPTDESEIYAYLGILISAGALQASNEPIKMLWSSDPTYCRPSFGGSMSRDRFLLLTRFLRFDDLNTRQARRETDRFAAMREVFGLFVSNCLHSLNPSEHLCGDEQLVGFRGKAPFRVYMKNKPDKYGLKFWTLSDTKYAYVHNLRAYLGKENNKAEKGQGMRVILDLTRHLKSGYGVTVDNFFTSVPLADELLKRKITLCGTLKKKKAHIPKELLPNKSKEQFSSQFVFTKDKRMVSYVPKKNNGVILLSTEHRDKEVSGEDRDYKPDIILHYNATKGGVDTTDKLAKRKTNRWPMVVFSNLVDIATVNGFQIWCLNHPDWKIKSLDRRREYLLILGKTLVAPYVFQRSENRNGLSFKTLAFMKFIIPNIQLIDKQKVATVQPAVGRKRCHSCPRSVDKKARNVCDTCRHHVCAAHSTTKYLCNSCDGMLQD